MRTLLVALLAIAWSLSAPAFAQSSYTFKHPSWMWEEGAVGVWHKARMAEFQAKYPTIKIEGTVLPSSNFEQTINTQVAAGDVPDLLPVFTNMLPPLMDAGALAPLDDCIAASSYKDRLLASVRFAQKDGKTYGVPLTMSPQSLLYNKKLLDAAGVSVPMTVEELYKAAKAIKEKTGEWGYAFNNNTSNVLQTYINGMQWVIGLGGDWSKADRTITADAPNTIEAVAWIKRFLDEGLSPRGLDVALVRTMFAQGKVGFLFDGPWVMTQVKTDNPGLYPSIGYGIMPTPTHAAITGGAFYTIPAKSPHKADACKYLDVINAEAAQREWLEKLVQIPGTTVQPSEAFLGANPWVRTMVEVAAKYPGGLGYAPPSYNVNAAEFRQIVVDHLAQIYAGQKDVKTALGDAQKRLEAWAKKL
ncbi:MAG: sugar ABC transporter substrate-binding protein [Proteobacteria bacterium]|nr:sugar ABC transporter substrate-binding protein [Pseudomonadota bacterium]MBI3496436.1 sugar ABC transporter substrate-binding protein [Pseudomonadota bacterium]